MGPCVRAENLICVINNKTPENQMRALNGELADWLKRALAYLDARAESGDPEPTGVTCASALFAEGKVHADRVAADLAEVERARGNSSIN